MVKIGVLTSSRADFGVYLPLLKALLSDNEIYFDIIAFGSHLSRLHGYTINEIRKLGFNPKYEVPSILSNDSENGIATSAALTSLKFADFWNSNKKEFDYIFCLGDRFEMFSAVIAGIPYGIKFIHFYGGDYSEGAIDNVYRDGMTHASVAHFTSNQKCADRVKNMITSNLPVNVIGILSLEDIESQVLLSLDEFNQKWNIDIKLPTLLITLHPETIESDNNEKYSKIIFETLSKLVADFQLVITLPNADTNGTLYRNIYNDLKDKYNEKVFLIENFGLQSYFSCMYYSKLMLGNTSSGISEAASFKKYFINIGNRQKGRECGENVINVSFDKDLILKTVEETIELGDFNGKNIYKKEGAINQIIKVIKTI